MNNNPGNTMKKLHIGIFGHYGNENLGDESIIEAVIQNIKKRVPDAKIYGLSIRPEDTHRRYNIEAFPIRKQKQIDSRRYKNNLLNKEENPIDNGSAPQNLILSIPLKIIKIILKPIKEFYDELQFLVNSYDILKKMDILLITGSNQFLDNFGGTWGFPYTLLKWSVLSKLADTKVDYVSVGAGPINNRLSMIFFRWACCLSNYVSLRDEASKKLIQKTGYRGETKVYPDLAHSLHVGHIQPRKVDFVYKSKNLPVLGINPMPMYDPRYWCVHDQKKYYTYVEKLARFSNRLIKENYPIFFFGTQRKDYNVIQDVLSLLESDKKTKPSKEIPVLYSSTVDELMANFFSADIIVATRFHGTVLSLLSEKPLLGICYYRKARDLMKEMEQGQYAVDLDNFTVGDLWQRFEKLVVERPDEVEKIRKYNVAYFNALSNQYDSLLL